VGAPALAASDPPAPLTTAPESAPGREPGAAADGEMVVLEGVAPDAGDPTTRPLAPRVLQWRPSPTDYVARPPIMSPTFHEARRFKRKP